VTASRAAVDFAACTRELTDLHFPAAERIRVVPPSATPTRFGDAVPVIGENLFSNIPREAMRP
jgi:hypothetical protein